MLQLHNLMKVSHAVACPIVFILFYDQSWQGGVFKFMKIDYFSSVFSPLGPFSQVFGKVKEWLILELHEMIRVLHTVVCPMGFNFLCDRAQQGGVLKLAKMIIF